MTRKAPAKKKVDDLHLLAPVSPRGKKLSNKNVKMQNSDVDSEISNFLRSGTTANHGGPQK
jgi:hypothetical protein